MLSVETPYPPRYTCADRRQRQTEVEGGDAYLAGIKKLGVIMPRPSGQTVQGRLW